MDAIRNTGEIRKWMVFVRNGLLVLAAAAATSCAGPEARFSTDRRAYEGGDTVILKNLSLAADSFEWSLNDKVVGHTPELRVVLDRTARGPQVIRLKAISGNKVSVTSQTVTATSDAGTVTVWATFAGLEVIQVSEGGEKSIGVTATGYSHDPGCSAGGCVNLVLPAGTYTIDGASLITRSRRVVELAANDCISVKMH